MPAGSPVLPESPVPVVRVGRVAVWDSPRRHLPALAALHRPLARGVRLAADEQVRPFAATVARLGPVVASALPVSALRPLLSLRRLLGSLALLPTRVSRAVRSLFGAPTPLFPVGGAAPFIRLIDVNVVLRPVGALLPLPRRVAALGARGDLVPASLPLLPPGERPVAHHARLHGQVVRVAELSHLAPLVAPFSSRR